MTDPEKLIAIRDLLESLAPEFKEALAEELLKGITGQQAAKLVKLAGQVPPEAAGELKMTIESNAELVRIDFGTKVSWIGLPKMQAIQFAALIMEHCGATVERVITPPPAGVA